LRPLITRARPIAAALEVIRKEDDDDNDDNDDGGGDKQKNQEGDQEEDQEEDPDEMDYDTSIPAIDRDEIMGEETSQQKTSKLQVNVDGALEILVRNAIKEFGFAPRDVYHGVFNLPKMRALRDHDVERLDYPELKAFVHAFSREWELRGFSHRVVAVYPRLDGRWEMNFKSPLIARKAVKSMELNEARHLWESYELLHKTPEGSCMAGWFFESIANRTLSKVPGPQPTQMASTRSRKDPPVFSTQDLPSQPPALYTSAPSPVPSRPMTVVWVDLTHGDLSDVTLDEDRYYIPTTTNHPLFDSFTINFNRFSLVISVFQITISPEHRGSAKGFPSIHKIMARVLQLSKSEGRSNVKIQVRYCLVCPEDGRQYKWRMPDGWHKKPEPFNHRGKAFCIRVPLGMFCPFAPNFAT